MHSALMLFAIRYLDASAGMALACIFLAVVRTLAALNMARSALLDLLHVGARALHVVFAVWAHHRCSLRIDRNEKQRANTGAVSAWARSDERSTADAIDTQDVPPHLHPFMKVPL
jgi:hypothetical protein